MTPKLRVLDLFSGIGGFSLGLERTGGFETVAFCEINEFCRRVLAKHWPDIPCFNDVRTIARQRWSGSRAQTALRQAFHARTYHTPEKVPDLPAPVPVSGGKYAEPFAWYDHGSRCWRTWQRCLVEGWELYSGAWPRSGMTRNGIAYRLPPLVPSTKEIEPGSLLPTLTVHGNYNRKGLSKTSGDGLATVLRRMMPTLTAHVVRGGCKPERTLRMWENSARGCDLPSTLRILHPESTGIINPSWAEGFMGYPIGWTELAPSETPSIRHSSNATVEQSSRLSDRASQNNKEG